MNLTSRYGSAADRISRITSAGSAICPDADGGLESKYPRGYISAEPDMVVDIRRIRSYTGSTGLAGSVKDNKVRNIFIVVYVDVDQLP